MCERVDRAEFGTAADHRGYCRLKELERLKREIQDLAQSCHDGDDLYQEVWLRFLTSFTNVDWTVRQSSLVMKTARRLVRVHANAAARQRRLTKLSDRSLPFTPAAIAEAREIESRMRTAVDQLREPYRSLLKVLLDAPTSRRSRAVLAKLKLSKLLDLERRAVRLLAMQVSAPEIETTAIRGQNDERRNSKTA